jgi:hypothetical protein
MSEVRSPRFRRFPFVRNGVSDHGRAVTPCIAVHNILPSTFSTASASATLNFSWLNIPLHTIAVYASRPSSPAAPQHSLEGGLLLPYPHRTLTGWKAPASPGALRMFFSVRPIVLSLARATTFSSMTLSSSGRNVHRERTEERNKRSQCGVSHAPKRLVAQELLNDLNRGAVDDGRLLAAMITGICKGSFPGSTANGLAAVRGLKAERMAEGQEAAAKRAEEQRRRRDCELKGERAGALVGRVREEFRDSFL